MLDCIGSYDRVAVFLPMALGLIRTRPDRWTWRVVPQQFGPREAFQFDGGEELLCSTASSPRDRLPSASYVIAASFSYALTDCRRMSYCLMLIITPS